MKRLDRFILKSFIGPFVGVLAVVVFILVLQFLWLYIDELVGKGLGLGVVLEFLMWGGCTILPMALPLATLLSSMMTLGQMTENNELMAIKASGISLVRVLTPLIVVSVFITIGAFFIGNNLVPRAFNEIYTLRDDIGKTKSEIKIPSGTFYDGIEDYVLRVEDQNDEGMMYSVMVYDHTKKKGNVSVTLADSATIKLSKAKDYLIFTLYNGTSYQEDNKRTASEQERQLQRISFDKQQLIISLSNYAFQKSDDNRYGNQTKSRKISSLSQEHDSLKTVTLQAYEKHYEQIVDANYFTFKRQLDSAYFAQDKTPFEAQTYLQWKSRKTKIQALEKARDKANNMASKMTSFSGENYVDNFYLRRTAVEVLKRFAQALACFILFFVGAPLGALIGKGGLGSTAIISVLFFVLYWVVDISGTKLANDGAVAPFLGAFISAVVLAPIGAYLCWKAVHDSTLFNGMNLKIAFKTLGRKIYARMHKTRIVYMGTPEFAVAPLDALVQKGHKVVGVVTVADKPSGRGLKVNESAVKKYAVEHNIPVLQPLKLKDPEFLEQLKALKADLFVVVAFRMLPEEVWKMPKLGTFNLHAALLPQYRGAAPINWAVINGERITGVTTFMIDHNIDTGGIILRQECRISPEDNAGTIHDKLMAIGSDLVVQTVDGIIEGHVETRVQRSFVQGSEVLKPAPKLTPELQNIDWTDTSRNIQNLIRGLSPYPAAYTQIQKGDEVLSLKIFASEIVQLEQTAECGSIITDGKTYLYITTKDGAISLKDIQLSGKKRMKVEDFLRGARELEQWRAINGTSKSELERLRNK